MTTIKNTNHTDEDIRLARWYWRQIARQKKWGLAMAVLGGATIVWSGLFGAAMVAAGVYTYKTDEVLFID